MTTTLGLVLKAVSAADVTTIAEAAEEVGVTHLYLPETGLLAASTVTGRDPFITSAAALRATTRMQVGPGIAASTVRPSRIASLLAATINEESDGRFIMGVGVSHRPTIEALGLPYPSSPLGQLTAYVREVKEASAGGIDFGTGFPVVVGALGPKMIDLAATESDGVILNWLTPEKAAATTAQIAATAQAAGKEGVMSALFIRVGPPGSVRADASSYNDNLPNYHRHFLSQGLADTDAVVAGTCMRLDAGAVVDALERYDAAGVTVPCVYPTGMTTEEIVELLGEVGKRRTSATTEGARA